MHVSGGFEGCGGVGYSSGSRNVWEAIWRLSLEKGFIGLCRSSQCLSQFEAAWGTRL